MTHPNYMGVWCPTCEQDCVPMRDGTCGFCDTKVADQDDRPLHTKPKKEEEPVEAAPICKIDHCDQPRHDKLGVYGGLCAEHREQAKAARAAKAAADPPAKPTAAPDSSRNRNNGADHPVVAISPSLVDLAQAVEDAKAALELALTNLRNALA